MGDAQPQWKGLGVDALLATSLAVCAARGRRDIVVPNKNGMKTLAVQIIVLLIIGFMQGFVTVFFDFSVE